MVSLEFATICLLVHRSELFHDIGGRGTSILHRKKQKTYVNVDREMAPCKRNQNGGFELAGPAAAGLLLFLEEVTRHSMKGKKGKKGGKQMSGGTTDDIITGAVYVTVKDKSGIAKLIKCTKENDKYVCTLNNTWEIENMNDTDKKRLLDDLKDSLGQIDLDHLSAAEYKVVGEGEGADGEGADGKGADSPAASAEGNNHVSGGGGSKRKQKSKPKPKKGGGFMSSLEEYMTNMNNEITHKISAKMQNIGKNHAQVLNNNMDGGAKRKKPAAAAKKKPVAAAAVAAKKKPAQRHRQYGGNSCDHFAAEMPTTFTGGKLQSNQYGGSIGGMVSAMMPVV